MLHIKCPNCGSIEIDRSNTNVIVKERIMVSQIIDYVIEGGNEIRVSELVVRSNESIPPYIEELDSSDLEFNCNACGFFFDKIHTDEAMMQFAIDNDLLVGSIEDNGDYDR